MSKASLATSSPSWITGSESKPATSQPFDLRILAINVQKVVLPEARVPLMINIEAFCVMSEFGRAE
jgi:hypothetical protein